MLIVIVWPTISWWLKDHNHSDFSSFQKDVDSFQRQLQLQDQKPDYLPHDSSSLAELETSGDKSMHPGSAIVLFPFDPNTATFADWQRLGIRENVARTILNFRSKGGKFSKKEDLKKIYGFKQKDYERLENYIIIQEGKNNLSTGWTTAAVKKDTKRSDLIIDLNATDSAGLTSIRGIGPVLASRIIKFRNKLGGFFSVTQLKDVYGLSEETYAGIKDRLIADSSGIKKIPVNSISLDDLKQHPYFRNPVASTLISYRNEHGAFSSAEELKNIDLISEELYQKILPYLEF